MKGVENFRHNREDEEEISVLTPEEIVRLLKCVDEEIRPLYAIPQI
jgi:hypothetical protein